MQRQRIARWWRDPFEIRQAPIHASVHFGVHRVSGFMHFWEIKPNGSILTSRRKPLDAESQGWAIAVLRHLYGLLDEFLGVVLKQFIEKDGGRIPAALGLATRISALSFRKFCHVSKPEFALNFSETVPKLLPDLSTKPRR
jgi:hypothetical protein